MEGITNEILAYTVQSGGVKSSWYVGIAADPKSCLFERHNVDETRGKWIYGDAGSESNARAIEKWFLSQGYKGGPGGGDRDTRFVYAYAITLETRE